MWCGAISVGGPGILAEQQDLERWKASGTIGSRRYTRNPRQDLHASGFSGHSVCAPGWVSSPPSRARTRPWNASFRGRSCSTTAGRTHKRLDLGPRRIPPCDRPRGSASVPRPCDERSEIPIGKLTNHQPPSSEPASSCAGSARFPEQAARGTTHGATKPDSGAGGRIPKIRV